MSTNPNTVKSQDDINEGGRKSDVLLSTIEELERTKKQLDIAKSFIFRCANDIAGDWYINSAKCVLQQIEELNK
ncbi:MAG: hypothetical protein J6S67_22175 [Methanobrevibacter sp.]|nr:hypothetical protein [Methanobrevibacter sp.]